MSEANILPNDTLQIICFVLYLKAKKQRPLRVYLKEGMYSVISAYSVTNMLGGIFVETNYKCSKKISQGEM